MEIQVILDGLHSGDLDRYELAMSSFWAFGLPVYIEEITQALSHPGPSTRCDAAELLCILYPQTSLDPLLPLLHDPVDFVRWNLLYYLIECRLYDPQWVEPLAEVLRNDPDADVRAMAAELLGRMGDSRAIPALQWASRHDSGEDYEGVPVSAIATRALGKIQSKR